MAVYDTALELAAVYGLDKKKVGVGHYCTIAGVRYLQRDLLMHTIALGYQWMMSKGISYFYCMPNWAYITPGKIRRRYRSGNFGCYPFFILLVRAGMSKTIVVYLADLLEPTRDFTEYR